MNERAYARKLYCAVAACASLGVLSPGVRADGPLYPNSVASNDIDFITESDPSAFERLDFVGREEREMEDKRPDASEKPKAAYVFEAHFSDRTLVVLVMDAAIGSEEAARAEAMRYVHPLGKLPTKLRDGIIRGLLVHKGGEDTTAFSDHGQIILYSDNATKRIGTHDLEETIFHESIHTALDRKHARSEAWAEAQEKDGTFVTEYARQKPKNEDLAETALFAYTLLHHPERIPAEDAARIRKMIPNRIAYIERLFPAEEPIFTPVEPPAATRKPRSDVRAVCLVEINLRGVFSDILSNCLRMDFDDGAREAASGLLGDRSIENSEALFQAVVAKLGVDPEKLKASVIRHQHVNCKHGRVESPETAEAVAKWKCPSAEDVARAQARQAPVSNGAKRSEAVNAEAGNADQQQAGMVGVVSVLRWNSMMLGLVLASNALMIALLLKRRSVRSAESKAGA